MEVDDCGPVGQSGGDSAKQHRLPSGNVKQIDSLLSYNSNEIPQHARIPFASVKKDDADTGGFKQIRRGMTITIDAEDAFDLSPVEAGEHRLEISRHSVDRPTRVTEVIVNKQDPHRARCICGCYIDSFFHNWKFVRKRRQLAGLYQESV